MLITYGKGTHGKGPPPALPKRLPVPKRQREANLSHAKQAQTEALEAEVESLKDAQHLQKMQFESMQILVMQHQQQNHNSATQTQHLQKQLTEQKKQLAELVQQLQQQQQEAIEEQKRQLDMAKKRMGVGSSGSSSTPSKRARGEARQSDYEEVRSFCQAMRSFCHEPVPKSKLMNKK